ncbi:hypothetical protein MKCMC460_62050 (plasmid) [Mycobacterium sp. 20KCMC460]|nr:hypothetical protein MKCMC460_62050 [Mycobacterium sp. 20KCMC460]
MGIEDVFGGRPHSSPRGNAENDPMTKMLGGQMETTCGYVANKDNYAKRLRRIEGQIRGIGDVPGAV